MAEHANSNHFGGADRGNADVVLQDQGLHLGQSLRSDVPPEFGSGLHLGQWMQEHVPDAFGNGLHLGQWIRESGGPSPQPSDLIVNGGFDQPGVGTWPEDQVPGWYVSTTGADQNIRILAGGPDGPFGYIPVNTLAAPNDWIGELSQNVEAKTGETYTIRLEAHFDFAALGPHVNGVEVLWNGEPVAMTLVNPPPAPIFWGTLEGTVVGAEGTDTLTLRAELVLPFTGSEVDNVSLTPAGAGSDLPLIA